MKSGREWWEWWNGGFGSGGEERKKVINNNKRWIKLMSNFLYVYLLVIRFGVLIE